MIRFPTQKDLRTSSNENLKKTNKQKNQTIKKRLNSFNFRAIYTFPQRPPDSVFLSFEISSLLRQKVQPSPTYKCDYNGEGTKPTGLERRKKKRRRSNIPFINPLQRGKKIFKGAYLLEKNGNTAFAKGR